MRGITRKRQGSNRQLVKAESMAITYLIIYIGRESKSALIPSIAKGRKVSRDFQGQ
jgi:hypothetical protein